MGCEEIANIQPRTANTVCVNTGYGRGDLRPVSEETGSEGQP